MDGPEERSRTLVVTRRDPAVLLQPGEEVLDPVPQFVQAPVRPARSQRPTPRRNDDPHLGLFQLRNHPVVGVVALVRDDRSCRRNEPRKQRVGAVQIGRLTGREVNRGRPSLRVTRRVDFSAQAPAAPPKALFLRAPFFAPAACWCARTMVESIIANSLLGQAARALKTRSQTPACAHLE